MQKCVNIQIGALNALHAEVSPTSSVTGSDSVLLFSPGQVSLLIITIHFEISTSP